MQVISYSKLRGKLKIFINQACEEHEPIVITRTKGLAAVLISPEDYNALNETAKLFSNPAQMAWLRQSIKSADKGKVMHKELMVPNA